MSAISQLKKPDEQDTLTSGLRFETAVYGIVYFAVLRDVKPFTWYCIKMLAFTRKGDGTESSCVFIQTEEGGKINPRYISPLLFEDFIHHRSLTPYRYFVMMSG